jgi:hypothetical protein
MGAKCSKLTCSCTIYFVRPKRSPSSIYHSNGRCPHCNHGPSDCEPRATESSASHYQPHPLTNYCNSSCRMWLFPFAFATYQTILTKSSPETSIVRSSPSTVCPDRFRERKASMSYSLLYRDYYNGKPTPSPSHCSLHLDNSSRASTPAQEIPTLAGVEESASNAVTGSHNQSEQ